MAGNRKRLSRIIALTLSMLIILGAIIAVDSATVEEGIKLTANPEDFESHTLAPRASDGVSIVTDEDGALTIRSHTEGNALHFDETKLLTFTAEFGEGWSYCENYSSFFPNDSRASVQTLGDGSIRFTFSATEGGSVGLEAFKTVLINATPDQLPRLNIETEVPFEDIGKLEWVDAHFTLTPGTKHFESGDYEGDGMIKGRGNSSWTYPKKPYSIKLSKKESLLDIPKTKKYAIIANYQDSSLMRNYITYKSFQGLVGTDYVPKCEFVDVYLNGEYNGVYLLTERIDIEKSKVDIEEATADDITGGYLIEKDCAGKINLDTDIWFNCPYWTNPGKDYFVLKAPEPDDEELTAQMLAYLEAYMQRVHDCLVNENGEPYTKYVDPASWVDFIIVQELSKNIDGNFKTSCFMYKLSGDDHLYMTAPWDFDFAYGLVSWDNNDPEHNECDCPPANTPDGFMAINSTAPWLKAVYENNPEFRELLKTRYTCYRRTFIDDMIPMVFEQAAYLNTARVADYELWGKNFTYGVNKLRNFLRGRIGWLDSQWLTEDGAVDLDYALNLYGGTLEFISGCDGENPFIGVVRGSEALAMAAVPGESTLCLTAELGQFDFLAFDYAFAGGEMTLTVNGEPVALAQQDEPGRFIYIAQQEGSYEFIWSFNCEDGCAFVDNVSVNFGHLLGDVNTDGRLDILDALLCLRFSMGVAELGENEPLADINGSGSVTVADALVILRRAMGVA